MKNTVWQKTPGPPGAGWADERVRSDCKQGGGRHQLTCVRAQHSPVSSSLDRSDSSQSLQPSAFQPAQRNNLCHL